MLCAAALFSGKNIYVYIFLGTLRMVRTLFGSETNKYAAVFKVANPSFSSLEEKVTKVWVS